MSKKLFNILIVLTIAASVLIAANNFEKKDIFYFNLANSETEITIPARQTVIGRYGWAACSMGLTQDFVDHVYFEIELYSNGALLDSALVEDGGWNIEPTDPANPPTQWGECLHVNEIAIARWAYDFKDLSKPGDYELHFRWTTTAPLTDGFDFDNDGYMDVYNLDIQRVKTIHVVP